MVNQVIESLEEVSQDRFLDDTMTDDQFFSFLFLLKLELLKLNKMKNAQPSTSLYVTSNVPLKNLHKKLKKFILEQVFLDTGENICFLNTHIWDAIERHI